MNTQERDTYAQALTGRSTVSSGPAALLVVGEERSNNVLAEELALDDYQVRRASDPTALRARCTPGSVDLIIFGESSHQGAGLGALRALRAGELAPQLDPGLRVLWMSTTGELTDLLRAFEAGADDVIRCPFTYPELLARARALLRRNADDAPAVIQYGALRIDTAARKVTFGSAPVNLRRQEYALLMHLAREPARVYTKDELLRDVWGFRSRGTTSTLNSHASRLRRALALAGAEGWVSVTWGVGYRLAPDTHG